MKLVSAHVENFGRLHDFNIEFTSGCNYINGHNGWGKSTLAAFIRVMLYGFEGENKRTILENERKRWQPWQGGSFGGSIVFEKNGKTYLATRTFGSKISEDTFELFDNVTMLASKDYSSNLGEELFEINANSYMRTAYIGQNDVVTATTDGINAKIGNIADSTNDLDCYEKASGRLADLINKNSARRSTGAIYKLREEVTNLQTYVRDGADILASMRHIQDNIILKQEEADELRKKRDSLAKKRKRVSEYKDIRTILDIYERISKDVRERQENANSLRLAFSEELPEEETLRKMIKEANRAEALADTNERQNLTLEEAALYTNLSEKYGKNKDNVDKNIFFMKSWRDRESSAMEEASLQADFKVLKNNVESAEKEAKTTSTGAVAGILLIIISVLAAAGMWILIPSIDVKWIGTIISGIAIIIGLIILLINVRKNNQKNSAYIDELNIELEDLEEELGHYRRKRKDIDEKVASYLEGFGKSFSPSNVSDDLMKIQKDIIEFDRLTKKQEEYNKRQIEIQDILNSITTYINSIGKEVEEDLNAQLNTMLKDLSAYKESDRLLSIAKKQAGEYESEHNIKDLKAVKPVDGDLNLGDLTEELTALEEKFQKNQNDLRDYNNQQNYLQEKLDIWEENRERLSECEKRLLDKENSYKHMQQALKYLTLAKENMTAKYMEPLLNGFKKYYGAVTESEEFKYIIDANTNVSLEELGTRREAAFLSRGYQDLVGFCMRLSLADAMYKEDKPVLILDDPFVNFDNEKRAAAETLLKIIEKDYQLIYFTCN